MLLQPLGHLSSLDIIASAADDSPRLRGESTRNGLRYSRSRALSLPPSDTGPRCGATLPRSAPRIAPEPGMPGGGPCLLLKHPRPIHRVVTVGAQPKCPSHQHLVGNFVHAPIFCVLRLTHLRRFATLRMSYRGGCRGVDRMESRHRRSAVVDPEGRVYSSTRWRPYPSPGGCVDSGERGFFGPGRRQVGCSWVRIDLEVYAELIHNQSEPGRALPRESAPGRSGSRLSGRSPQQTGVR